MKYFILLVLASSNAFAYTYSCFSIDDNEPYGIERFKMVTKQSSVVISFEGFKFPETYVVANYSPKTPGPRATVILNVKDPHYSQYGEGPVSPFYGDKDLMTGGYTLRDGKMGGFLKTTGHGYSWAKYICSRNP